MNPVWRNPKVDAFLAKDQPWLEEMRALREIALECRLREEFKWGWPCYTAEGKNLVLIHAFKEYCALLFMKGALLKDPDGLLIRQTENVNSGRQIRFSNLKEVVSRRAKVKAYVIEAVEVEKTGLKVAKKTDADYPRPEEFEQKLAEAPALKAAFEALTLGRQRGYLLHFAGAKQSKTRAARIEKCAPLILAGKGLDD
jgi:uncharacterized protein YdeI (YjbR/CyaY-like superfamily)